MTLQPKVNFLHDFGLYPSLHEEHFEGEDGKNSGEDSHLENESRSRQDEESQTGSERQGNDMNTSRADRLLHDFSVHAGVDEEDKASEGGNQLDEENNLNKQSQRRNRTRGGMSSRGGKSTNTENKFQQ